MTKHHTVKSTKHPKETMLLKLAVKSVDRLSNDKLEYLNREVHCKPLIMKVAFFLLFDIDLSAHDNPNEGEFGKKLRKNVEDAMEAEIANRKAMQEAVQTEAVMMELRRNEQELEKLRLKTAQSITSSSASSTRGSGTSGVASDPIFSPKEKIKPRADDPNMVISPSNNDAPNETIPSAFASMDPSRSVMDSGVASDLASGLSGATPRSAGDAPITGPGPTSSASSTRGSGTSGVASDPASGLVGNGCGLSGVTSSSSGVNPVFSPLEKIESRKDDTNMVISPSNNVGIFRLPYHTEQIHQQYRSKYASKHNQFGFINGVPDFKQQRHRHQSLSPDHGRVARSPEIAVSRLPSNNEHLEDFQNDNNSTSSSGVWSLM